MQQRCNKEVSSPKILQNEVWKNEIKRTTNACFI